MANQEQLSILKQGVEAWNKWRRESHKYHGIDLSGADLEGSILYGAYLTQADLREANLQGTKAQGATFEAANLCKANLSWAEFDRVRLDKANLNEAVLLHTDLEKTDLTRASLVRANLNSAALSETNLSGADLSEASFLKAIIDGTVFAHSDLSKALDLDSVEHRGPSSISTDTLALSKGKIPADFLRGCGLSDVDIEYAKIFNPELSNEEINGTLYKIYDLRVIQALQISPLFISYAHADSGFIDKVGDNLTEAGIRYWRDIHDMKAGRVEKQIDRAIRQNPTVLLVLSKQSLNSDWVEHEVRTARALEKEMGHDVLCPVALDDAWKDSSWPKRILEQVLEYNILDFSGWQDDRKFEDMFRKMIDGLELFYRG